MPRPFFNDLNPFIINHVHYYNIFHKFFTLLMDNSMDLEIFIILIKFIPPPLFKPINNYIIPRLSPAFYFFNKSSSETFFRIFLHKNLLKEKRFSEILKIVHCNVVSVNSESSKSPWKAAHTWHVSRISQNGKIMAFTWKFARLENCFKVVFIHCYSSSRT